MESTDGRPLLTTSHNEEDENHGYIYLWLRNPPWKTDKELSCSFADLGYFTSDREGKIVLTSEDIEELHSLRIECTVGPHHRSLWRMPENGVLDDLHAKCGFNPDSDEIAEYLGYEIIQLYSLDVAWIYLQLQLLSAILSFQLLGEAPHNPVLVPAMCALVFHYSSVFCEQMECMWLLRNPERYPFEYIRKWVPLDELRKRYPDFVRSNLFKDYWAKRKRLLKRSTDRWDRRTYRR